MSNGNYVVTSSSCDSATAIDVVTWGNGTTGITGTVTASNSLVGTTSGDNIGNGEGYCVVERELRRRHLVLG